MDERSGTVRLVESRPDIEVRGLVATVSRHEVEEVLRADEGPVDLLFDVEFVAPEGDKPETERIALAWEPQDLERLLGTTSGDQIALTFDEEEVRRLLDDVEAHGMREKLAVLTVVAGMAAASVGSASGAVFAATGGASEVSAGLTGVSIDRVTASEVSTGLGDAQAPPAAAQVGRSANPSEISTGITGEAPAAPSEISTGIVQEPAVAPAEITTGVVQQPTATPVSANPGGSSTWAPGPEAAALAVGTILALTAVGFALRTQRRPPAMP